MDAAATIPPHQCEFTEQGFFVAEQAQHHDV